MAEIVCVLNTLCEPCYFLSAENERERVLKTDTLFRTNIDIFECFFLQYTTEFIRFSSPLNQKKKTVSWSCSVGVANVPLLIKFSQDWKRYLAFFLVSENTYGMLHACTQESSASTMRNCLKKKKKKIRFNFCLLKNFETKMTNLVSDLFILLSVHPLWGKDVVG